MNILLALLCLSCDRKESSIKTEAQEQFRTQLLMVDTVAQLEAGKQTHLAVAPTGEIYMVQETPGGRDVVYSLDSTGKLKATAVDSSLIAGKSGLAGGEGHIQSIAIAGKDRLWFYFAGQAAEKKVACVGEYIPSADQWRMVFDTEAIRSTTRLGAELDGARGTLIRCGGSIWLWIRGEGKYSLQCLDSSDVDRPSTQLPEPVEPLQYDGTTLPLQKKEYELSAGAGSSLLVLDLRQGAIWAARHSELTVVCSLVGMPRTIAQPVMGRDGWVLAFVADGPPLDIPEMPTGVIPKFPALLMAKGEKVRWIEREDMRVPTGVSIGELKLQQMEAEKDQQWVGYDETSGKLLRVKIVEKQTGSETGSRH